MLVEQQKRASRVRFKHPVRVVTLDGQPRVIRTLAANVSHKGMFVRMPEPLPMGTRVALSLEAGGRALALAQAEVVWARPHESQLPGRFAGCGVRFTDFLHPRAQDLVGYLVDNLDRGKPLQLAPPERPMPKWLPLAAGLALLCCALGAALIFHDWSADSAQVAELDEEIEAEEAAPVALVIAAAPVVKPVSPSPPGERVGVRVEDDPAAAPARAEPLVAEPSPTPPSPAIATPASAKSPSATSPTETSPTETSPTETSPTETSPTETSPTETSPSPSVALPSAASPSPPQSAAKPSPVAQAPVDSPADSSVTSGSPDAPRPLAKSAADPSPSSAKAPATKSDATARVAAAGEVPLPQGATDSLRWSSSATTLKLQPAGTVTRAFVLLNPARAVFDVSGATPARSHTLSSTVPHTQGIRIGKLPSGTRVVIDLDAEPRSSKQDGDALVLAF